MDKHNKKIRLQANAKINLSLYITGQREDGYHLIDSVFAPIDLCDVVTIKKGKEGIAIRCSDHDLAHPSNTAYKAAQIMMQHYKAIEGVEIFIEKHIPAMAGLGGGSADAAATLLGIMKLYDISIEQEVLERIALEIGADVPFFLGNSAARIQGIGEKVTPINQKEHMNITLVKPNVSLSTPVVYRKYDEINTSYKGDCDKLINYLKQGDLTAISSSMYNDLQQSASDLCPEVNEAILYLQKSGAMNAIMTGSGSCVFGIFENEDLVKTTVQNYKGKSTIYSIKTVDKPILII
ncbi:MAG: 4-(cytidine 5'-diphospho)-2-C-methyl-D-erythritol kinase [Clostridiales bacterium]|nr:4-(cytidine 5'-diphospho)-2-C-methyl-D-erythritol kinase [Clostridiales bacterium]